MSDNPGLLRSGLISRLTHNATGAKLSAAEIAVFADEVMPWLEQ